MNTSYEAEFLDWYKSRFAGNQGVAPDKLSWVRARLWDAWVNCRVWRLNPSETAKTFDAVVSAMRLDGYTPVSKGHPGSPLPPEGGTPGAASLDVRKAA